MCMLLTFYLYYLILKPMQPSHSAYPYLDRLAPSVLVIGGIMLLYFTVLQPVPYLQLRSLVIVIRESAMLVYTVLIFIPYTLSMWRDEHNAPLKLKYGTALTCFTCFAFVALNGVSVGVITLAGYQWRRDCLYHQSTGLHWFCRIHAYSTAP